MSGRELEDLRRLIDDPTETLQIELKGWIDPASAHGERKIVCGVAALFNQDGGYLVFGIDDKTRRPAADPPVDIRAAFNEDQIQASLSRCLSEPVAVEIRFVRGHGIDHPVIIIPSGVRTPVVLKREVGGAPKDALYVRTLRSGGVVSTAPVSGGDWPDLMRRCFDNREADIGGFIRRQLAGMDMAGLLSVMGGAAPAMPSPSLRERTEVALGKGRERFEAAVAAASPSTLDLAWGGFEIAVVFDPPAPDRPATEADRRVLAANDPGYGGMALWYDGIPDMRPAYREEGLEALVVVDRGIWPMRDFMRFEPGGVFYQNRLHDADASALQRGVEPGRHLDPGLAVQGVGESLAAAIRYGVALGWDPDTARVGVACRWTGLAGRALVSLYGDVMLFGSKRAEDDVRSTFMEIPLATAPMAVAPWAETAVAPMLAAFDGWVMPPGYAERRVLARLQREG